MVLTGFFMLLPFGYFKTKAWTRNLMCLRWEIYAVRDGVYYNHFKTGFKNMRATQFRGQFWA